MKLLIGRIAIVILILAAFCLGFLNLLSGSFAIGIALFFFGIIFIPIFIWIKTDPCKAFLLAIAIYIISAILRQILLGGEYLLSMLMHLYFILSMVIGSSSKGFKESENKVK